MRSDMYYDGSPGQLSVSGAVGERMRQLAASGSQIPRHMVIGIILVVALLAFEMFNFDTTQYALRNLLGDVQFLGLAWASILAVAFCSIDFAGLIRMFTPERGADEPKEVWYLMGAWLLGATMNALMTWWAISLTLLNHQFGNEVLGREQLLKIVPIFVAVLVWLTRILFIGSLTVTGERLFRRPQSSATGGGGVRQVPAKATAVSQAQPTRRASSKSTAAYKSRRRQSKPVPKPQSSAPKPAAAQPAPKSRPAQKPKREPHSRVRQRPPMPRPNGGRRSTPVGVQARSKRDGR